MSFVRTCLSSINFGRRVHLAVEIDQDIRPLPGRQHIAELLNRPHERPRAVALAPGLRDLRDPLFLGEAGGVLLMLLVEGEGFLPAVAAGVVDHAFGEE